MCDEEPGAEEWEVNKRGGSRAEVMRKKDKKKCVHSAIFNFCFIFPWKSWERGELRL